MYHRIDEISAYSRLKAFTFKNKWISDNAKDKKHNFCLVSYTKHFPVLYIKHCLVLSIKTLFILIYQTVLSVVSINQEKKQLQLTYIPIQFSHIPHEYDQNEVHIVESFPGICAVKMIYTQ